MIKKLQPYVENPAFEPLQVIQVSRACHSLCLWVHAMYNYYFVNLKVAPKMEALAKADEDLLETKKTLAAAMDKLREVEEGINGLQELLRVAEEKKNVLENEKKICEERMLRAVRLVVGLADEQKRWVVTVANIKISLRNIIGDILLAAGTKN